MRRRLLRVVTATALACGALVGAQLPAAADAGSVPTAIGGTLDLVDQQLVAGQPSDTIWGSLDLSEDMTWNQPAVVGVQWDADQVRQGRALDPVDTYTRPVPGTMSVAYSATGTLHLNTADFGTLDMSVSTSITTSGSCALMAGGGDYTCHLSSGDVDIFDPTIYSPPGLPYLTLNLVSDVTISPQALDSLRTASTSSQTVDTAALQLGEDPLTDDLSIGCRLPVGDSLTYQLGDFSTTPGVSVETGIQVTAGVMAPTGGLPPVPTSFYLELVDHTFPLGTNAGAIAMTGAGGSVAMGQIQANNIPPTLGAVSVSPDAVEGSPVQLGTSATGPCADGATYRWDFGDGSGPGHTATPQHTYADDGVYTGQVVVTDTTGLTDTRDFTVVVGNLAPVVGVLPDNPVTVPWGKPLTLKAQAVDPGSADQATLTYDWTFADGDALDDGGPSTTHQWATPGVYTPTVQVCDKDGACTTRAFDVTVRKRATTLSYVGPDAGTWSAPSGLTASLVDEFGNALNGASVAFTVGGGPAGSATTNASGQATRNWVVTLDAGSYAASATYGGSALYQASGSGDAAFDVAQMGTTLTYTGGLKGVPNKVTALSATLRDALGRPVGDKEVVFKVGSQSVSATTTSTGVATASLKITQKPGYYPLTVTWSGTAGQLLGDDWAGQFSVNKK